MLGPWTLGKFSLAEATALYLGLITHIQNDGNLESMTIVGKYPNNVEANTYGISKNFPVFISVEEEENISDQYCRYLKACNTYFNNQYTV